MLRSRSWEISIPLARKTLDMQDLYPCKEDIASFFSSTGRWGNQLLLDSCLDRINCLTWHHSPNGRVIGKSIARSKRSGNYSWLGQPGAIRTISTFSVLTLFRQALIRLVGGYAYAYRPSQFWTRLSTFQDASSRMGETYIANFVFFPRANRSTNGLPQARKILSATVWFRLPLSCGFDPSGTDGPLTHSDDREGSGELVSFPSSGTTDICLWLNRSLRAPLISQVGNRWRVVGHESNPHILHSLAESS